MLTDLTVRKFVEDLGSEKAVPGGGSASALAAALGAALVKMVAHLSGEGQDEVLAESAALMEQLLVLVQRDTEAFNQVMAAFKLPRTGEEEKKARSAAIQAATRVASEVPLQVMELCQQVLVLAKKMAFEGNKNALSDAGVAALLGMAACQGAAYNVLINLSSLKDQQFAAATKARLQEILAESQALEQAVRDHLTDVLG